MLIDPAKESAGVAGVGTFVTSTRETLFNELTFILNDRDAAPPAAETTEAPSDVNDVLSEPSPRTEIPTISTSLYSVARPGINLRNSPTLPPRTSPKESAERTFLMFAAKRCSLIARDFPSVSRSEVTTKLPSFTMSGFSP